MAPLSGSASATKRPSPPLRTNQEVLRLQCFCCEPQSPGKPVAASVNVSTGMKPYKATLPFVRCRSALRPVWAAPGSAGPHKHPECGCSATAVSEGRPRSGSCHRRRDRTTCGRRAAHQKSESVRACSSHGAAAVPFSRADESVVLLGHFTRQGSTAVRSRTVGVDQMSSCLTEWEQKPSATGSTELGQSVRW